MPGEIMMSPCNGSDNSDASVDEERVSHHKNIKGGGCQAFGFDPVFEAARRKLAERVAGPDGLKTGDCDHKTRLLERIGGGSFGDVYLGEMIETKLRVAVKIEPSAYAVQSLLREGNVYHKLQHCRGIPTVHWYGLHGSEYAAMVMDLMGKTLYDRWVDCGERFSLKTVLMLIDQMLDIMEHVHGMSHIHRDLSPNNFMFGLGDKSNQVYLIDFGHAKELDSAPKFIPGRRHRYNFAQPLVGTPRFSSVFTHMGLEPSYRDDMESLGYIWIYLLKGRLPWQGLRPDEGRSKLDLIAQTKCQITPETLCADLPPEFAVYMNYIRSLKHLEMPDHSEIRQFFRRLAEIQNIEYDGMFDWIIKEDDGNDAKSSSPSSSSSSRQTNGNDTHHLATSSRSVDERMTTSDERSPSNVSK